MIVLRYSDFRAVCAPGEPPDKSGYEAWPVGRMLYPPGETGFNLALPTALTCLAEISVNGLASDATSGIDEFDWYLWQRTDDPARQMLALQRSDTSSYTRSGTVLLAPTALAATRYLITATNPTPSPEDSVAIFRDVWLGVRRRSNGRIMMANFLRWAGL